MPARPPHYFQETKSSCAPACLRMILEFRGHVVSEIELRQRCECDDEGTNASKIVEVARQYGLSQSSLIRNLQLDQLQEKLSEGLYPIVYLQLFVDHVRFVHSVVVVEISEGQVTMLDPETKDRALEIEAFNRAWLTSNGTIIIE